MQLVGWPLPAAEVDRTESMRSWAAMLRSVSIEAGKGTSRRDQRQRSKAKIQQRSSEAKIIKGKVIEGKDQRQRSKAKINGTASTAKHL
jgi:hypothetical protein